MPLWNIGWCSYYHLESKVMNYPDKKAQIIQFHWFNRKVLDREIEGCKCIHCRAFLFQKVKNDFYKRKNIFWKIL